ncbi:MAG: DUF3368 domain-containing protein [Cyanobacteria bacterium J06638_22]
MIIVSDTSPINYLLLIGQIHLLPKLFAQIIIPDAVRNEMLDPDVPLALRSWMTQPPPWLTFQLVPLLDDSLKSLDRGEQAAITLAQILSVDLWIIDECLGRRIARERGLSIIGTLGILDDAASQGWVDVSEAIAQL